MRVGILPELLKGREGLVGAEIGVFEGELSEGLLKNLGLHRLYLVDAWKKYSGYRNEADIIPYLDAAFAKVEALAAAHPGKAVIVRKFSDEAVKEFADGALDFVYIDANHRYEYAKMDIEMWEPKVRKGGIVAGHDYLYIEVQNAVKDHCEARGIRFHSQGQEWWWVR